MSVRVLIIEDESLIRWSLRQKFVERGYEVAEAEDGRQALERFTEDGPYDLLMLDYRLPDMTGLDILRQVRKGAAVFEDRFTAQRREVPAALVVDAGHRLPEESLWEAVASSPSLHVVRVGDCVAPRTIHEAILEGRRAAIALG